MTWLETPHEMRHSMRAPSKGTVMLRTGGRAIHGRIHDLGTGGVAMRADQPLGLRRLKGRCVHLDLRLDGGRANWFGLDGHVLRTSVPTRTIVVALDAVPSDYEDYVQDQLLDAVEHHRLPHVILVDVEAYRRAAIASSFRGAGCQVVEAATPLEAISKLGEAQFEPEVIAISDTEPESIADELRRFLAEHHPFARMLALHGDDRAGRGGGRHDA